jgi:hypothetical protein
MDPTALNREAAVAAAAAAESPGDMIRPLSTAMEIRSRPPLRFSAWPMTAIALAAMAVLAGCTTGDFGEPRPAGFMTEDAAKTFNFDTTQPQPFHFDLTDDERQLRALALPLLQPPYDRREPRPILEELGLMRPPRDPAYDRSAYWFDLSAPQYSSPSARYARLIEDIRDDMTRLPQFFETAGRVLAMDDKRRQSLAVIRDISPVEQNKALRRIQANAAWVAQVQAKLPQRVAAYQYALERLVIGTPATAAAEIERSLNQLRTQISYYRTHPAPTWSRERSLVSAR